jgi:hypothetical protein
MRAENRLPVALLLLRWSGARRIARLDNRQGRRHFLLVLLQEIPNSFPTTESSILCHDPDASGLVCSLLPSGRGRGVDYQKEGKQVISDRSDRTDYQMRIQ